MLEVPKVMTAKHKQEVMDNLRNQIGITREKMAVQGRRLERLQEKLREVDDAPTV